MNLDDEERAGTRSRKYIKQKGLRLFSFLFMLLLFLFLFNLQPTQKTQNVNKDIFEIKHHFKDASEYTDYSFLKAQLTEAPKTNQQQQGLMKKTEYGHSFEELVRLTNPIILSSIFTFKSTRRVPVTAVIHTVDINQIYFQLKSVLTQTALAESIYIICKDKVEKQHVMERIDTLDKRRVHVMVNNLNYLTNTASEFIWILDQNVVPGKRYLEHILKLTYTEEYKNTLIGTQAFDKTLGCIPWRALDITNKPVVKSQEVDFLMDNWLIYRTWIPLLLSEQPQDRFLLGLYISQALYKAGIPTVALPTDAIERAYYGDTRVQKSTGIATTSSTCQYWEKIDQKEDLLSYQQPSSDIVFFANTEQQIIDLAPLYCRFYSKNKFKLDFISPLPEQVMLQHLGAYCNDNKMVLHHLDLQKAAIRESALMHALEKHIKVTTPSVMIHTAEEHVIHTQMTVISLPSQDIPHTLWLTELPIEALKGWHDFKVKIMINSNNKPHGLSRLLQSLNRAYLLNDDIELTILLDQSTDRVTQKLAESFQLKGSGDHPHLRHRIVAAQRTQLFAEAWYPSHDDEYAIILDNTMELSPFFYTFTKYNLLYQRHVEPNQQVFGISLYSPRILETDASGRTLFEVPKSNASVYFMQWPSHLGAVFFPRQWREFHDYMTARLADRNGYDLQNEMEIQGLRSSQWTHSWRRYFEELVYLRGYVMVYPRVGLAKSFIELRNKAMREEFAQAISLFETPLMENDFINDFSFDHKLVLDIYGKQSDLLRLKEIGKAFQTKVSACTDTENDASDLLCPFARLVSVTLENEKDPIPELPIRQVTIYKNSFL